jgi:phospholipid/cholesterol/gamma-HCH transport system permease protein
MQPSRSSPDGPPRVVDVVPRPPDGLELRLCGSWRLDDGMPGDVDLAGAGGGALRSIAFDGAAIDAWDSSLVSWVDRLARRARDAGLAVDLSRLPDGVQRLLDLAAAVPPHAADGTRRAPSLLAALGTAALELAQGPPRTATFLGEVVLAAGRALVGRARFRATDLWWMVQEVGPRALPIVSLISFLVGVILAYMGALQLAAFGAQIYIADLVGIGMVRELGALMTGIILAGRSGAAFAAQIGTMQVNEEVDALRTLGIQPVEFLVLPRAIALIAMTPLLTLYAGAVGILAGLFICTTTMGIDPSEYLHQTVKSVTLNHVLVGVLKGTTYGVLIALAGCLRGLQCGRSAQAVGEATTSAVVTSILWIVIAASTLTVVFQRIGI